MGKSKKTRWRTFSFEGSKEDETNVSNGKLSDKEIYHNSSDAPHKYYSQVLGDHHSNYTSQVSNRSSSIHNSKTRNSYNNKENYYNQRSAAKNILSSKLAFQRKYASNSSALKDNKKLDGENGSFENKDDSKIPHEPIKFNEDEYTRITTPRQDVLFKKGYLSRMNSNNNTSSNNITTNINLKTVSPPSISTNDSTAPNSTVTNSDQESSVSVSTLSPATTPSMDYGQQNDGMEYAAPLYYPGYYDENGILVIPMYNGYNGYYSNSSSTSPVYLMPYPYHQYDPFFMAPNTEVPIEKVTSNEQDEESAESSESKLETEKTNNEEIFEEQNGAIMSSEDAISNSSNQREETEINGKDEKPKDHAADDANEPTIKPLNTFYPNEYGYMYPTYSNGFYNGLYYYPNGMASLRPPKMKRRKRFLNLRNVHHSRSAETTTDYSDDDNINSSYAYKRYNPRHYNNWMYHSNYHNNHNQYHYDSKYSYHRVDKNANETSSNLNVDVPEFYPGMQSKSDIEDKDIINKDKQQQKQPEVLTKSNNDLQVVSAPKIKAEPRNNKPSHTTKTLNGRVSKKEIIEGIKLMEQQNINLVSTSKGQLTNIKSDDEWNVIKNGKKIKILKEPEIAIEQSNNVLVEEVVKMRQQEMEISKVVSEVPVEKFNIIKKTLSASQAQNNNNNNKPLASTSNSKSKKSKGKNKKKKNNFTGKQDGFEIIEPEFGNNSDESNKKVEQFVSDDETYVDESTIDTSNEAVSDTRNIEPDISEEFIKTNNTMNDECKPLHPPSDVKEQIEEQAIWKVLHNIPTLNMDKKVDDDIIDISDEDLCNNTSIEIDINFAQEIADEIERQTEDSNDLEPIENRDVSYRQQDEEEGMFSEINFFENHKNIAELERDLMENLKILDDGIDIKSPIINPLYDFPITSAVQKWLQEKQNESFESLFRLENFKKLSELYDDCENDDDDKSDISDSPNKSETTDSDYASDIQFKINGSPASSNAKIDTKISSKCNNKIIVKESFCALM